MGRREDMKHRLDVVAYLIEEIFKNNIDIEEINETKFNEFLWPYLQLKVDRQVSAAKHRIICSIVLNVSKYRQYRSPISNDGNFMQSFQGETVKYFIRTLKECTDPWTQLYALVGLENCQLTQSEISAQVKCNERIEKLLTKWKNYKPKGEWGPVEDSIELQLHLECQSFYDKFISQSNPTTQITNQATLNPEDKFRQLKLSRAMLEARSDWRYQSVRSICLAKEDIFYFEAKLLTSGPMNIGWATKRTELERSVIGGDMFSVAIDGFNQVFSHDNSKKPLEAPKRWKAGDVVGCLMDTPQKKFTFFLEDRIVELISNDEIYFSNHPYYAGVSLASYQQVLFNFGQH